jgi:hypothetical protein
VKQWWASPNKAFDEMTPYEMLNRDETMIKNYLLAQLSGDYL